MTTNNEFFSKHSESLDWIKGYSSGTGVLNGVNRQKGKPAEEYFSRNIDRNTSIFGRSGHILSRTTISSRILRKWQDAFWVHLLPATLAVFRSEESFKKWASNDRRNGKVLLMVDFDTFGTLKTRIRDEESIGNENFRAPTTKLISSIQKYSLGDVQGTFHGSEALYTCKLERFSSVGVDLIGSFASTSPTNLRSFRKVIQKCIQATTPCKQRSKRSKLKKNMMPQLGGTCLSTGMGSEISGSICHSHSIQIIGRFVL